MKQIITLADFKRQFSEEEFIKHIQWLYYEDMPENKLLAKPVTLEECEKYLLEYHSDELK